MPEKGGTNARPPTLMKIYIDEDLLRLEQYFTHPERVGILKAPLPFVNGAVLCIFQPLFHALVRLCHHAILAFLHPLHVHGDGALKGDAELLAAPGHVSGASTGYQGLGGDAAGVDTGAAEELAFNDGHLHSFFGQSCCQRGPRLSCADDDRVVLCFHVSLSLIFQLSSLYALLLAVIVLLFLTQTKEPTNHLR